MRCALPKLQAFSAFVQTSSVAAIAYGHGGGRHHFTEADWTNIESPDVYAYVKSKTIAERAAGVIGWPIMVRAWNSCRLTPSAVLGPVWSSDFSASIELVKQLLSGALPRLPRYRLRLSRCARCRRSPCARADRAGSRRGKRFIAAGPFLKMIEGRAHHENGHAAAGPPRAGAGPAKLAVCACLRCSTPSSVRSRASLAMCAMRAPSMRCSG